MAATGSITRRDTADRTVIGLPTMERLNVSLFGSSIVTLRAVSVGIIHSASVKRIISVSAAMVARTF